jgi:hypothetical protein
MVGEDAQLAQPLGRDAARGQRRDRARGELEPGVRQVLGFGEHGNTDRVHARGTLAVSASTRSMSWIIRSSTTSTSVARGEKPASRRASM